MKDYITLKELHKYERSEYSKLNTLMECKLDYQKRAEIEAVKSIEDSIRYQRSRWGMICDLIELLEDENEE